jgi:hypothetical protein
MLYAQLSSKKSLRDLVFSLKLKRHRQKLYHLGINRTVKRSSLADANKYRPARIFSETYFKLLHRLESDLSIKALIPRRVCSWSTHIGRTTQGQKSAGSGLIIERLPGAFAEGHIHMF